jgi:hypothetical protein
MNPKSSPIIVCKEIMLAIPVVIYSQKDFYLLDALNEKIEMFNAAGLIDFWQSEPFSQKYLDNEKKVKHPEVLRMTQLFGCFEILFSGCVLSFALFLLEHFYSLISRFRLRF